MKNDVSLPVYSISRHRMGIDGTGITTLVGAYGCPLQCRYCLNPHAWDPQTKCIQLTPLQLYEKVVIDDLYFLATNGGITFGGGEALLHAAFIREFYEICQKYNPAWRLTVETSLQVPLSHLKVIPACVDQYIIDIKDMNPAIYISYTQKDNVLVMNNLSWLLSHISQDKIKIRVPLIPNYNTNDNRSGSVLALQEMGFQNVELFSYVIR